MSLLPSPGILLIVVLVAAWEVAMRASGVVTDSFAPPTAVLLAAVDTLRDGTLLHATAQTLLAALTGLMLGAGAGVVAGLCLGLAPGVAFGLRAPIDALRTLPSVALIPLSLMAFGFGYSMELAIIAFATFWPALILAQSAVSNIDRQLLEVARMLQLGTVARLGKIVLPAATERLIVALRLAVGIALVVAVTVEITANPQGLGYALVIAQQSLHPDQMLAFLLWIGVLGWLLNWIVVEIERRVLRRWGVAMRRR